MYSTRSPSLSAFIAKYIDQKNELVLAHSQFPNIKKEKLVHGTSRCNSHTVVYNLNVEANLNLKFWGVVFSTLNSLV